MSDAQLQDVLEAVSRESHNPDSAQFKRDVVDRLRELGPDVVPALIERSMEAEANNERLAALIALGVLGDDADSAIPNLLSMAKDHSEDYLVRVHAIEALSLIGQNWSREMPWLISALDDPELCDVALGILEELGPAARDAVPALLARVNAGGGPRFIDVVGRVRSGAVLAVPELATILRVHSDPDVREACVRALSRIDPTSKTTARILGSALSDVDGEVRATAAKRLASIGEVASVALSDLRRALRDCDPAVRKAAAQAIERIDRAHNCRRQRLGRP
jgi:HEAT repeat protein